MLSSFSRGLLIPFFLLFIFSVDTIQAQERDNYELLWEIKHKGSNETSYLFGTIHVKDKRVFEFSDAVLPAIQKSEAFALEIHPDSLMKSFPEQFYNNKHKDLYKKILSEEEYALLNDRLFELNGVHLDSLTNTSPFMIESMLTKEVEREDDRRTFLDAYLYGLAHAIDKEILGLEKVEDQVTDYEALSEEEMRDNILDLLSFTPEASETQLEEMIQLYYEGDLAKIFAYSNGINLLDEVLLQRNLVMVNSLEEIMANKTVFAAVGSAHLPGTGGLIDLLKKRGYEINRVPATFNNSHSGYDITPNLKKWYFTKNDSLGYSVYTPTEPAPINYDEEFEIFMSTDLISGGVFGYMMIDLRAKNLKEGYDFIENIILKQVDGDTTNIVSKHLIEKDGITYIDVIINKDGDYTRSRLAFTNKIVYNFMVENKLKELQSPYIEAFFDSVKIYDPVVPSSIWTTYTNERGAFSVQIPEDLQDITREVENPMDPEGDPYVLHMYAAEDRENEMIYIARYNDQPTGYYLDDIKANEAYFSTYFNERGTVIGEPSSFTVNGYKGYEYEVLLSDRYHAITRIVFRGNRTYLLLAQTTNENGKTKRDNRFFNSFEFTPYMSAKLDTTVTIDERYTVAFPKQYDSIVDTDFYEASEFSEMTNYRAKLDETGGLYLVGQAKIKPYFREASIDAFYDYYIETLTEPNDTLVVNKKIEIAGVPGRELEFRNSENEIIQRMRILVDNDNMFLLQSYLGEEELAQQTHQTFFSSFEIKKGKQYFDITASKGKKILKDIVSSDSLKSAAAIEALAYYTFEKKDLSGLLAMLSEDLKNDTLTYGTKNSIIESIASVADKKAVDKLASYYLKEDTKDSQRIAILEYILNAKTPNATATYFKLLNSKKPIRKPESDYDIFTKFGDSTALFVTHSDKLTAYLEVDDFRDKLLYAYSYQLLDSSSLAQRVPDFHAKVLSKMRPDVNAYVDTLQRKNNLHINYGSIDSYLDILELTGANDAASAASLKQLYALDVADTWLSFRALTTALTLNMPVEERALNAKFDNLYTRFELIEALIENELVHKIPKELLSAKEFSKLSLYNAVGYEDGSYPDIIEELGTVMYEDQEYMAYSYGFEDREMDSPFLGVTRYKAGNIDNLQQNDTFLAWDTVTIDWQTQAKTILANYLEE